MSGLHIIIVVIILIVVTGWYFQHICTTKVGGKKFRAPMYKKGGLSKKRHKIELETRKNIITAFKTYVPTIKYFQIVLEPFLENVNDGNADVEMNKNDKLYGLYISRLNTNYNNIITDIFSLTDFKYVYVGKTNKIHIFIKPTADFFRVRIDSSLIKYKPTYDFNDVLQLCTTYFAEQIRTGPDGWLNGNITFIKTTDVEYTINVNLISINYSLGM